MTRNSQQEETEYFSSFCSLKWCFTVVAGKGRRVTTVKSAAKQTRPFAAHCKKDMLYWLRDCPALTFGYHFQCNARKMETLPLRWTTLKIILHRLVDLTIWMVSVGAQQPLYSKPFRNKAKTFAAVVMNQSCYHIRLTLLGNWCSRLQVISSVVQAK